MKSALVPPLLSLLLVSTGLAQPVQQVVPPDQAADGVYRIVERGAHHRSWLRILEVEDENGFLQTRTNAYQELTTSMHRWDQDKWVESSDEIEILEDGAVARKSHIMYYSQEI